MLRRREIDPAGGEERPQEGEDPPGERSFMSPNVESFVKPIFSVFAETVPREHLRDRDHSAASLRAGHRGAPSSPASVVSSFGSASAEAPLAVELEAHVTVPAAAEGLVLLAEVAEHEVVTARASVEVAEQIAEEVPCALGERRVHFPAVAGARHEPALEADVPTAAQEGGPAPVTVTAGATDLLVVGLDRRGRLHVDDGAVGAVDAHAERVRRDDDECTFRDAKRAATLERSSPLMPAWYALAVHPCLESISAYCSVVFRVAA